MIAASRWIVPAIVVFAASVLAVRAAETTPSVAPTPTPTLAPAATPKPPKTIWTDVRVHQPYIAMTFDDGPSGTLTPRLLDILKARNMHVTFFVVGENAKLHPRSSGAPSPKATRSATTVGRTPTSPR